MLVEGVKLRNEHKIRTTRMNSRSTLGLRGKGWGIGIKGWGPGGGGGGGGGVGGGGEQGGGGGATGVRGRE